MVNMGVLGSLLVEMSVEGADDARADMEGMQRATQQAGNTAKKQVPVLEKMTKRWASVLTLVAASGATAFGLIAKSSPSVMASLKGIQLSFEDIFNVIGEELSPVFETLGGWLFSLAERFNDLSPTTKTFIAGLALGVIVIGAVAAAALAAVAAFAGLSLIAGVVGVSIGVLVAVMAGAVVAVALLYSAWRTNFLGIRDIVGRVKNWIVERWTALMDIITDENKTTWGKVTGVVQWAWDTIKDIIKTEFDIAYNYVTGKIKTLKETLSSIASYIKGVFAGSQTQSDGGGIQVPAGGSVKARPFSGRAMGGTVLSGASYLVGENGPEMFTPGQTGNITPNKATMQAMNGTSEKPIELNLKIETKLDGRTVWESMRRYQGSELRRLGV